MFCYCFGKHNQCEDEKHVRRMTATCQMELIGLPDAKIVVRSTVRFVFGLPIAIRRGRQ